MIGSATSSSAKRPVFPWNSSGKERDETGFDYFLARYYSGTMGRFTSPDPRYFQKNKYIDPQQFNLYSYTRNNPLKYIDPLGEDLYLHGDIKWLLNNILYPMAGGEERFYAAFYVASGQVFYDYINSERSKLNVGQLLILEMVESSDKYVYYAGTDGDIPAKHIERAMKNNGRLNGFGNDLAKRFEEESSYLLGTKGRPSQYQPIDPFYAFIAFNTDALITQTGLGDAPPNPAVLAGIDQVVLPVSFFIHESAEMLAFRTQKSFDYDAAHLNAIYRELAIRFDLNISGGFCGGEVDAGVP